MTQEIPPWVIQEAEKKPRRKPGPKPKVKPDEPKRLHVRVELMGSVELILEDGEAKEFRAVLNQGNLDEVLDYLDPWASGIEIKQETRIVEDGWPGESFHCWAVHESTGIFEGRAYGSEVSPFRYTVHGGKKPHAVDWRLVR